MNTEIILLMLAAFGAGFIDAVVGGGGLIQLPALMLYLPRQALSVVFAINKFAGFSGTLLAAYNYSKRIKTNWQLILPAVISAVPAGILGAFMVTFLEKEKLKPIILIFMTIVLLYTLLKKDFGQKRDKNLTKHKSILYSLIIGLVIGFYDGFFGPGTGSFLVFFYVSVMGLNFIEASAAAKIINAVTNLAALAYFGLLNQIDFSIAIPLAAFNILGSVVGTKTAIKKGTGFVRLIFIGIVSAFIIKLFVETIKIG